MTTPTLPLLIIAAQTLSYPPLCPSPPPPHCPGGGEDPRGEKRHAWPGLGNGGGALLDGLQGAGALLTATSITYGHSLLDHVYHIRALTP